MVSLVVRRPARKFAEAHFTASMARYGGGIVGCLLAIVGSAGCRVTVGGLMAASGVVEVHLRFLDRVVSELERVKGCVR